MLSRHEGGCGRIIRNHAREVETIVRIPAIDQFECREHIVDGRLNLRDRAAWATERARRNHGDLCLDTRENEVATTHRAPDRARKSVVSGKSVSVSVELG